MSSRQIKSQPLSDGDIQRISAEVAEGRTPMVWFTAHAVGVPEGRSGKVLAVGDPGEGDFLQIRPTGSPDVLSFSPTEVTLTKPPAKRAATKTPEPSPDPVAAQPEPIWSPAPVVKPAPTPTAAPVPTAAPRPATASRKAKAAVEVTLTLTGTADGEWTVDVINGKKRAIRGLSVSGSAVAQAAKSLHPDVSEAIEAVLEAARAAHRAKVEQLQAELAEAQRQLEELSE